MKLIALLTLTITAGTALGGTVDEEIATLSPSNGYNILNSSGISGHSGWFSTSLSGYCSYWGDSTWSGGAPYTQTQDAGTITASIYAWYVLGARESTIPDSVLIRAKVGFSANAYASTNAGNSGALAYGLATATPATSGFGLEAATSASVTIHSTQNNSTGTLWSDWETLEIPLTEGTNGYATIDIGSLSVCIHGHAVIETLQEVESSATSTWYLQLGPHI